MGTLPVTPPGITHFSQRNSSASGKGRKMRLELQLCGSFCKPGVLGGSQRSFAEALGLQIRG